MSESRFNSEGVGGLGPSGPSPELAVRMHELVELALGRRRRAWRRTALSLIGLTLLLVMAGWGGGVAAQPKPPNLLLASPKHVGVKEVDATKSVVAQADIATVDIPVGGAWTQATTDGFITGGIEVDLDSRPVTAHLDVQIGESDGGNEPRSVLKRVAWVQYEPPTILNCGANVMVPVRKGQYYRVTKNYVRIPGTHKNEDKSHAEAHLIPIILVPGRAGTHWPGKGFLGPPRQADTRRARLARPAEGERPSVHPTVAT